MQREEADRPGLRCQSQRNKGKFPGVKLDNSAGSYPILTGENLTAYDLLGALPFHMATNHPLDPGGVDQEARYLGESEDRHVWLIYKDDLDWLKSQDAALTLSFVREFAGAKPDKPHLEQIPSIPARILRR